MVRMDDYEENNENEDQEYPDDDENQEQDDDYGYYGEEDHHTRMKRKDKTAPIERDARKPLTRAERQPQQQLAKPKAQSRDPRFDHLSGHLSMGLFQKSYTFLKDQKVEEVKLLQKAIKKCKVPAEKEKLRLLYSRNKDELKRNEMINQQRDTANRIRRDQHITPNRSIMKKEMLTQKFDDLSKKGKLEDFMAQKRRRLMWKLDKAHSFVQ